MSEKKDMNEEKNIKKDSSKPKLKGKKEKKEFQRSIPFIISVTFIIFATFSRQWTFLILGSYGVITFYVMYKTTLGIEIKGRRMKIQGLAIIIIIGIGIAFGFLTRGTYPIKKNTAVWQMHEIDNPGWLLPNGLDPADVNKDGYNDYVTNYEWDGKIRIAFYPGLENIYKSWPAITVGEVANAENAAFGDFDSDGNIDIVVAHGTEFASYSGVFIIWGPESENINKSSAWIRSKDIPSTINSGQLHYTRGRDVNGDGSMDIVVGGRGTNPKAGIKWIEAPSLTGEKRNMENWIVHTIDAELESGHGFVFEDVDLDGDDDIVVCNTDWDTPNSEEKVLVYINPGDGTEAQKNEWQKIIVYQGSEFYTKEQVTLYDYSGDGFPEILMQIREYIYMFENPGIDGSGSLSGTWNLIKILKSPEAQWRARPINIADINNDGKMDIVGMLIHHEGYLPKEKATVFWMEYTGSDPMNSEWITHPIKYSDGFFGIGTYNGEKWDNCLFEDIDQDGDLDIVANCEEYHSLGFVFLSVVWFENPTIL